MNNNIPPAIQAAIENAKRIFAEQKIKFDKPQGSRVLFRTPISERFDEDAQLRSDCNEWERRQKARDY